MFHKTSNNITAQRRSCFKVHAPVFDKLTKVTEKSKPKKVEAPTLSTLILQTQTTNHFSKLAAPISSSCIFYSLAGVHTWSVVDRQGMLAE